MQFQKKNPRDISEIKRLRNFKIDTYNYITLYSSDLYCSFLSTVCSALHLDHYQALHLNISDPYHEEISYSVTHSEVKH